MRAKCLEEKSNLFQEVIYACKHIYHHNDVANKAKIYLSSRISKKEQEDYDFGYFPSDDNINILLSLIDKKTLEKAGLIWDWYVSFSLKTKGLFDRHNLILPLRNGYGNIISIAGRTLLGEEERKELGIQKYKYTKNSRKNLYVYGLNKAKQSIIKNNFVICVEGQFDCIALQSNGFLNSVALGWTNLSVFQACQILRYTNNILLILDNDDAGEKSVDKILNKYKEYNLNIATLNLPSPFKDCDELLKIPEYKEKFKNEVEQISKGFF